MMMPSDAFHDEITTLLWPLVNVASTGKWINPRFAQILPNMGTISSLLASLDVTFGPGMEDIFSSFVAPDSSWFESLPHSSRFREREENDNNNDDSDGKDNDDEQVENAWASGTSPTTQTRGRNDHD